MVPKATSRVSTVALAVENLGFQWRSFCWWIFLDLVIWWQCGLGLFTTKGVKKFATWLRTLPNHISVDGVTLIHSGSAYAQNGSFFLLLSPYTTVYQRLPTVTRVWIWLRMVHMVWRTLVYGRNVGLSVNGKGGVKNYTISITISTTSSASWQLYNACSPVLLCVIFMLWLCASLCSMHCHTQSSCVC